MMDWIKRLWGKSPETPFTIPVLCYHSWTVNGHEYGSNDHISLEQDLRVLGEQGYEIISAPALVELIEGGISAAALRTRSPILSRSPMARPYLSSATPTGRRQGIW